MKRKKSMARLAWAAFVFMTAWLFVETASAQIRVKRDGQEYYISPKAFADAIEKQVAEIRGLEFRREIDVENQSIEAFEKYLDRELQRELPAGKAEHFGKVIRKLGLYRGPEIGDFRELMKSVMKTQAAAYYDPETSAFYVLMSDLPELMLGSVYAHELYHGLQDQHFDLEEFLLSQVGGKLNDDELLARQAVVEGEATYVMTIWSIRFMTGVAPDAAMLDMTVGMQSSLDYNTLQQMVKSNAIPGMDNESLREMIDALGEIPPFVLENILGVYMKGMGFVHAVRGEGWGNVAALYEHPPVSSEQILHPGKYVAGDVPHRYAWPEDEKGLLEGWRLLEDNTLGELMWRVVFSEFGMPWVGEAAAAGWDGDRYRVYEREEDGELLLLMTTTWDSGEEAGEFQDAYRKLLETKYPDGGGENAVRGAGRHVHIVEGIDATTTEALLGYLGEVKAQEGSIEIGMEGP